MKESQGPKKFRWSTIFKAPFSRRGKQNKTSDSEDTLDGSSYEAETTQRRASDIDIDTLHPLKPSDTDASSIRGPSTSIDGNLNRRTSTIINDIGSVDGRCQSPAPSQATRSHRHSMSKTTSGENVRVSLTVDTIKQQLSDGLQVLAEFKKSLRASSDVQRYNEAVGSFEGAAKDLAMLKTKLSNRKLGGSGSGNGNRNSWVLPPPDLKLDIEDTPFSIGIPGIEESQKEMLEAVQENKENEAQEESFRF